MFKRWSHLHSHLSGAGLAVCAIEYRLWLLLAAAFLAGVAFEWARRTLCTMAEHFLWRRKRRLAAARTAVKAETERIRF